MSAATTSPLRRVLAEITESRGDFNLDQVARTVGVSADEARAMVDYWVRKGRLSVEQIGSGCPTTGCGGCVRSACPSGTKGPVLLAITPRIRD
ncbi:FeoC-like transcriptional regulator [Nocardia sp. CDC153]|uniref:FeoC-like transcriptional regulator n=1 Tax=Nocardia sp. CDC153 TaxID=3112167 RepID=UPI002DBC0175|nr:FeoC-like transcriptional regulator [Nocardia sp. CDC153]MEC3952462.1 FeoC-like transcriptional regulator [Nocardia sp. CDC153]